MNGWKTWVAAIGMMLTGLGMVAAGLTKEGGFQFEAVKEGLLTVAGGFGMVGLGGKLDKVTAALKSQ